MRTMRPGAILTFAALFCCVLALVAATLHVFTLASTFAFTFGAAGAPSGAYSALAVSAAALLLLYGYGILVHRLFLRALPLYEGGIAAGSRQEFVYQVYLLFYLMLFNSLMRGGVLPIPLMRLVYLALGARLGANTYSSGMICDPIFVCIGANSMVGEGALLVPHLIEGNRLGHYPIAIGSNVTIGAHAVVLSGVTIGDDAIVAANSVVAKGVQIGPGQVWGGNPARRLR